jgi:hypothetical protein
MLEWACRGERDEFSLQRLRGQKVKLEFELRALKLFSFRLK